jgi:hypothetical protein
VTQNRLFDSRHRSMAAKLPLQASVDTARDYLSSDAGPLSQTLLFVVVAPLLGGRRAMFRPPKYDREIVKYFREPLVPERPSR